MKAKKNRKTTEKSTSKRAVKDLTPRDTRTVKGGAAGEMYTKISYPREP